MIRKSTNTTIAVAAVIIFLMVLGWLLLFNRIQAAREMYSEDSRALRIEETKEEYLKNVGKIMRTRADDVEILDSYFIHEDKEIILLEKIERIARRAGVSMDFKSFEKRENMLRLKLSTEGTFQDTYYFLSLIEALPLSLSVETLTLLEDNSQNVSSWGGDFDIRIHSFLPKE